MFNLIVFICVAAVVYVIYLLKERVRDTNKTLIREAAKLSRKASIAAKNGDYSERDRLDECRSAVLSQLTNSKFEAMASEFDDFNKRYGL